MSYEKITNFTDLHAWKVARDCVLQTYQITRSFPGDERFGLTNQMRRAAVSISSNIAEGFARRSDREKRQFYYIARGSVVELQSQLFVARDLEYVRLDDYQPMAELIERTHRLINGLITYVS